MFVCLDFSSHSKIFHSFTTPLPVKGRKFLPVLGTYGHWTVRVLCRTYCDTMHPFIMVISSPKTRDTHTSLPVLTTKVCLGFEHPTFRLDCERSNPLRLRRVAMSKIHIPWFTLLLLRNFKYWHIQQRLNQTRTSLPHLTECYTVICCVQLLHLSSSSQKVKHYCSYSTAKCLATVVSVVSPRRWPLKTDAPCHNRCGTLKNHCTMAMSADYRSPYRSPTTARLPSP